MEGKNHNDSGVEKKQIVMTKKARGQWIAPCLTKMGASHETLSKTYYDAIESHHSGWWVTSYGPS